MKNDQQSKLRQKRNEYLLGIVGQFQASDEPKNLFTCYDYVKFVLYMTLDEFSKSLTSEERHIIDARPDVWWIPIESIGTFDVFLKNNGISFN
jgi:hypothetical protein